MIQVISLVPVQTTKIVSKLHTVYSKKGKMYKLYNLIVDNQEYYTKWDFNNLKSSQAIVIELDENAYKNRHTDQIKNLILQQIIYGISLYLNK